jgi:3-methyl-2-oxobutanoate hydroxymethyltransferase
VTGTIDDSACRPPARRFLVERLTTVILPEGMHMSRITIRDIWKMKERGEKFAMLTAYDYSTARLAEEAGIPMLLVGDSLGMVVLGYDSTIPVTMEDMLLHVKAVARGTRRCLVVGDMPFMSYHESDEQALHNAGRLMQEGGAQAVKLEGGANVAGTLKRIVEVGIPVMGHIGLTPQSVHGFGGYRVQGKTREGAERLLHDALALQEAGAFALVLELVPASLSRLISQHLRIPTIGIGAGPYCDGQVQVVNDMLGMYGDIVPKHTKLFLNGGVLIKEAIGRYIGEVREGVFPGKEQSPTMDESVLEGLK